MSWIFRSAWVILPTLQCYLSICGHAVSFYWLGSFIFLKNVLQFSECILLLVLLNLLPDILLFWCCKYHCFLNIISVCLLLLCRNTVDFLMWFLCPATSPNSFISSIFIDFFKKDFLYIRSYHLHTEEVLCFPFQSVCLFYNFHSQFPWLEIVVRRWTEATRAEILALFLIVGRKYSIFLL